MAVESVSPTLGMSVTGVMVIGVATGIHPLLLIGGILGGYYGLSLVDPMSPGKRIFTVAFSGLTAAWAAPLVSDLAAALIGSALAASGVTSTVRLDHPGFGAVIAASLGVLANPVLLPALVRQARSRTDVPQTDEAQ